MASHKQIARAIPNVTFNVEGYATGVYNGRKQAGAVVAYSTPETESTISSERCAFNGAVQEGLRIRRATMYATQLETRIADLLERGGHEDTIRKLEGAFEHVERLNREMAQRAEAAGRV